MELHDGELHQKFVSMELFARRAALIFNEVQLFFSYRYLHFFYLVLFLATFEKTFLHAKRPRHVSKTDDGRT